MRESGISTYFNQGKIRIRYMTIEQLDFPEHIHLRINEEKKHLFIEKCEQDIDSFRIEYQSGQNKQGNQNSQSNQGNPKDTEGKRVKQTSYYINSKPFLQYAAHVIGVSIDSPSLRFTGQLMPDGTIFIDLNHYTVISYEKDGKHTAKKQ